MSKQAHIKDALERAQRLFAAKPEIARVTRRGRATLREGVRCEYTEEGHSVVADEPQALGGEGKGLTPSGLARAAITTCLAIGYALRAAQSGIDLRRIDIDIEGDIDLASLFGMPGVARGFSEFRYSIAIESEAAQEDIVRLIDEAEACSPVLDIFRRTQNLKRTLRVTPTGAH